MLSSLCTRFSFYLALLMLTQTVLAAPFNLNEAYLPFTLNGRDFTFQDGTIFTRTDGNQFAEFVSGITRLAPPYYQIGNRLFFIDTKINAVKSKIREVYIVRERPQTILNISTNGLVLLKDNVTKKISFIYIKFQRNGKFNLVPIKLNGSYISHVNQVQGRFFTSHSKKISVDQTGPTNIKKSLKVFKAYRVDQEGEAHLISNTLDAIAISSTGVILEAAPNGRVFKYEPSKNEIVQVLGLPSHQRIERISGDLIKLGSGKIFRIYRTSDKQHVAVFVTLHKRRGQDIFHELNSPPLILTYIEKAEYGLGVNNPHSLQKLSMDNEPPVVQTTSDSLVNAQFTFNSSDLVPSLTETQLSAFNFLTNRFPLNAQFLAQPQLFRCPQLLEGLDDDLEYALTY